MPRTNGEHRPAGTTPTPKRREDLRIQDATPEALTKALFGGATKRPETQQMAKVADPSQR